MSLDPADGGPRPPPGEVDGLVEGHTRAMAGRCSVCGGRAAYGVTSERLCWKCWKRRRVDPDVADAVPRSVMARISRHFLERRTRHRPGRPFREFDTT
jgi:hypothetical protein